MLLVKCGCQLLYGGSVGILKAYPVSSLPKKSPKGLSLPLGAYYPCRFRHKEAKGEKEVKKVTGPGLQAETASPKERSACFVGRAMPHLQVGVLTGFSSGLTHHQQ